MKNGLHNGLLSKLMLCWTKTLLFNSQLDKVAFARYALMFCGTQLNVPTARFLFVKVVFIRKSLKIRAVPTAIRSTDKNQHTDLPWWTYRL